MNEHEHQHGHQDLESRVASTFERRAGDVHGAPLTLDDVRSRARSVQRRRRAVPVAVAAALVAILAPVLLLTGGGNDRAVDPAPPAPKRATAVLHDRIVTFPDGSTAPLPASVKEPTEIAHLTDGRVVVTEPGKVVVMRPDGSVEAEHAVLVN